MMKSILEEIRQPKMVFEKIHADARLPFKAHPNDVGWDIFSVNNLTIEGMSSAIVSTGLNLAFLDEGYWMKIESRSGLAFKHDVFCVAGIIDNEYRGEIKVKMMNFSKAPYEIKTGDRIAQLVINYLLNDFGVEFGKSLPTSRGNGGFGSTGK
jgi:deoxyuridine 5'-triphosphate nucleotidohydrolase